MRGAAILAAGTGVSPVSANSLTSGGNATEHLCIRSSSGSSTMFATNSRVSRMLRAESLRVPSARRSMLSTTIGGSSPITLKKLNGAALSTPCAERVETNAIGRGITSATSSL
jgi:hypothetical protein